MRELFEQGGWTFVAIFAVSLMAWGLITWKWLQLRAETAGGLGWTQQVIDALAARRHQQAMQLCQQRRCMVGRLLAEAALAWTPQRRFFQMRMQPMFESEKTRLRSHLELIAVAAGLSPLLGLLGTVLGMIVTFSAVTTDGNVRADALASGIGQALITTQAGLVVALPIVLAHGWLSARIERCIDQANLCIKKLETTLCVD